MYSNLSPQVQALIAQMQGVRGQPSPGYSGMAGGQSPNPAQVAMAQRMSGALGSMPAPTGGAPAGYGGMAGLQLNRPGSVGTPMTIGQPGVAPPVQPVRPQTGQLPPSLLARLSALGMR